LAGWHYNDAAPPLAHLAAPFVVRTLLQLSKIWMDTQAPARLQSDNGKEFTAGIIKELCQSFGVKQIHGSIGRPQTQGAVERSNRTIKDKISAQLMLSPTINWSIQVPLPGVALTAPVSVLLCCALCSWWSLCSCRCDVVARWALVLGDNWLITGWLPFAPLCA
jgi:transposase InsO family protein